MTTGGGQSAWAVHAPILSRDGCDRGKPQSVSSLVQLLRLVLHFLRVGLLPCVPTPHARPTQIRQSSALRRRIRWHREIIDRTLTLGFSSLITHHSYIANPNRTLRSTASTSFTSLFRLQISLALEWSLRLLTMLDSPVKRDHKITPMTPQLAIRPTASPPWSFGRPEWSGLLADRQLMLGSSKTSPSHPRLRMPLPRRPRSGRIESPSEF